MNADSNIIKKDVVIIGKGPAGVQAALYMARAGLDIAVVGHRIGGLAFAAKIENYYGLFEPVSGAELQRIGEAQLRALDIRIIDSQVVGFGYADDGEFTIITTGAEYQAKAILLATGVKRGKTPLDGIEKFEGKGVSYCAVCDAFLYRGRSTGVLGHGEYAYAEARELAAVCGKTVIFTNGAAPDFGVDLTNIVPEVFEIIRSPIDGLEGDDHLTGVRFRDGRIHRLDALFIAHGTAGSTDLARKLGVFTTPTGDVITDLSMATNIPGFYAAGDCTGVFRQIAVAVGQGALAARSIIEFIRAS